jgi:hypothetical protein
MDGNVDVWPQTHKKSVDSIWFGQKFNQKKVLLLLGTVESNKEMFSWLSFQANIFVKKHLNWVSGINIKFSFQQIEWKWMDPCPTAKMKLLKTKKKNSSYYLWTNERPLFDRHNCIFWFCIFLFVQKFVNDFLSRFFLLL